MVLTGYNTDIESAGTTYHVQTEDKGRSNPSIETLVYARGEILYSRRTSYSEMVEQGVAAKTIATVMDRQHRTLVEAIRRGKLSQLLGKAADETDANDDTSNRKDVVAKDVKGAEEVKDDGKDRSLDQVILDYLEAQRGQAHLVLRRGAEQDFVYGETGQVRVCAFESSANAPLEGVRITVLFKSTAEPRRMLLAEGATDSSGNYAIDTRLPDFNGGTSAVVITGQSDIGVAEIKHLVRKAI